MESRTLITTLQGILLGVAALCAYQTFPLGRSSPQIAPSPEGIGLLTSQKKQETLNGLFCLTGPKVGVTAAHLLENTEKTTVEIHGQSYPIQSWHRVLPTKAPFPQNDLAVITLSEAPPAQLPRFPLSTSPPIPKETIYVGYLQNSSIDYAQKTLFKTEGPLALSNAPHPIYRALLWLNGEPASDPTTLSPGDSGGPWIQNGQIIGVTSCVQNFKFHPSSQILYACGAWQTSPTSPTSPTPSHSPIAYKPLLLSSCLLLLALQARKRKLKK